MSPKISQNILAMQVKIGVAQLWRGLPPAIILMNGFVRGILTSHTSLSFLQRCEKFIGDKDFLDKIESGIKSQNTFLRQDKKGLLDEVELKKAQKAFQGKIEKAKVEAQKLSDLRSCFVRIQTDFRRGTQPIHILAFARGMLYFDLPIKDEWIEKGLECALQELPQILHEHYEKKER